MKITEKARVPAICFICAHPIYVGDVIVCSSLGVSPVAAHAQCDPEPTAVRDPRLCAGWLWTLDAWDERSLCRSKGSLEHDGKLWCKLHHPPTVEAKRKAEADQWEADRRKGEERMRAKSELVRKAAAYDRMADLIHGRKEYEEVIVASIRKILEGN